MKKIVVIGQNSFIARHLKYWRSAYRFAPNDKNIRAFIDGHIPDVIINCIGYCGSKTIDQCETNKEKTLHSNLIIPTLMANECEKRGIHFVSIGSGCIYYDHSPNTSISLDGPKDTGWKETDFANAVSFYSKTKYACDLAIGSLKTSTILRIRMPVSHLNHPRNLLNKLISYNRILIEPNSMTFVDDLVRAIDFVIEKEKTGIYHIASPEPLTHDILLEEYQKYFPKHQYDKITKDELAKIVVAPRSNCILDCNKIMNEGFEFTNTYTHLSDVIRRFVNNVKGNK